MEDEQWHAWVRGFRAGVLVARPAADDDLTISPDGRWFFAMDKVARVWDLTTGREVATADPAPNRIGVFAVSPNGRFLATAATNKDLGRDWVHADGDVRVWDLATGRLAGTLHGHTWVVRGIAWRRDGGSLATAAQDGTVRTWDAATGKLIRTCTGHRDGVWAITFNPDGSRLASGGVDRTVRLWDALTGEEVLSFKGHMEGVWSVAFDAAGHSLITRSGTPAQRKVWDARPTEP